MVKPKAKLAKEQKQMFGANEIVGRGFFKDANDRLMVTSMFMTLQGEGPFQGMPSFFVRLTKCNLACSFCDTFFDKGDWFEPWELRKRITLEITKFFSDGEVPPWARVIGDPAHLEGDKDKRQMVLVITGGEPSLQLSLVPFLKIMHREFKTIQIESNGIQVLPDLMPETFLVVSPKCREDKGQPVEYLKPNPDMLERADALKFVMSANMQSPYSKVPEWAHEWRWRTGRKVYCSPMNVYNKLPEKAKQLRAEKGDISLEERSTVDEVISFWEVGLINLEQARFNHEYTARYCINHGLNLTIQMHLLASVA